MCLAKIIDQSNYEKHEKVYLYDGPNKAAKVVANTKPCQEINTLNMVLKEQLLYRTQELVEAQAQIRDLVENLKVIHRRTIDRFVKTHVGALLEKLEKAEVEK